MVRRRAQDRRYRQVDDALGAGSGARRETKEIFVRTSSVWCSDGDPCDFLPRWFLSPICHEGDQKRLRYFTVPVILLENNVAVAMSVAWHAQQQLLCIDATHSLILCAFTSLRLERIALYCTTDRLCDVLANES